MNKREIRDYFERVASDWDRWHQKNAYYHNKARNLIQGMIPPGSNVLQIGCGTGDLLAAVRPRRGIGLNLAHSLTELARRKYPHLEFYTVDVDSVNVPDGFRPDYVVLDNMLNYVYDVWDLLENLQPLLSERTLLVVTTSNPLWAPILRFASRIGQRIPDTPRNFITNRDIASILELQGFDVIEQGLTLPVPKWIPGLGSLMNVLLPELPLLRYSSSLQYLVARPRVERPNLSVSVIIPCHNEEENIVECVRRTPRMGAWTEIIVVDDGTTDGTQKRVRGLMSLDPSVRLLVFDHNQGKANAVRAGFEAARGDVLMILDADMAVAPEELPKFLKPLAKGTADFVNGTRLVYPMAGHAMKVANYVGNKAFCYLVSWIVRQRVSDTLCGTKALLRRDYVRKPLSGKERWGDFDLIFGAARLRLGILEIPVHYQERRAGRSKMRAMREVWLFLRACYHGWHMLRFPHSSPWEKNGISGAVCKEILEDMRQAKG